MSAARTAVVWRCPQFWTKKATAVIHTPVKATTPANVPAREASKRTPSIGTRSSAPAKVIAICRSVNCTSGWCGDHSDMSAIWKAQATAQPTVSASPSRTASGTSPESGRVRTKSPTTARATPAQAEARTRRPSRNRLTNGTSSTAIPVRNPERDGVV